jgi:hypothetical protein
MSRTRRHLPASYVVRVYRADPSRLDAVAGLVEDVDAGSTTSFRNGTELLRQLGGAEPAHPDEASPHARNPLQGEG